MKKPPLIIGILSSAVFLLTTGVCYGGVEFLCAPGRNENLAILVMLFTASIIIISFTLLFFNNQFFYSWFRFTKYFLPIAIILVVLSPSIDSSIFGFDKEFMSWFLASIFLLTSLILIARKWWQIRKSDSQILNT